MLEWLCVLRAVMDVSEIADDGSKI
jgi:hypothetical protein